MPHTMRDPQAASHREQLAAVRCQPAKASLDPQVSASPLREVAADAIRSVHGKQETAANEVGIHYASLSRQLKDGSLRLEQMEKLGPAFAAKFGQELVDRFAPLVDPKDEARRALADIDRAKRILEQFVDVA